MKSYLFMAFLVPIAAAGDRAIPDDDKPIIWVNGYYDSAIQNVFPPDKFRYVNRAAREAEEREDGYIPPARRDALFRRLGFESKLEPLDQMDKDMLVMGARDLSATELRAQYPMLSLGEIRRLKAEVRKLK